ncbi:hypothetical protein KIJ96_23235 (plasmid) [Pseudoalteromonas piscicida]|uniref:hypothetical protein n=1 Tax=Pseudoalteromonas piscicida TaxID=43662 RepID=UPI001D0BE319|nr:hypothetical protein [Pseudoalteromonas piscicida]UDM63851.1 hypothetical protein KIJ96_23235 [Pseudoalteromonas piscicida]
MKDICKLAGLILIGITTLSVNAGETTLKLSKPSGLPSPVESARSINIGSVADNLFSDLRSFEVETESGMRRDIAGMSKVKSIYAIDVDAKRVSATFSGTTNYKVKLTLKNINLYAKVKFSGIDILCPSVTVTARLNNLAPTATYNYYTGALEDLAINYNRKVDASCSTGLFSIPGVSIFVDYFASDYAKAKVDDLIKSNLRKFSELEQPGALFGMQKILADRRVSANISSAERALNIDIEETIANLVTGMNIYIDLKSDANGYGKHFAQIGVYQSTPTINSSWGGNFSVAANGANRINKYALTSGRWHSSDWTPGILYDGQFIGAIAFNRVYGVASYMGQKQVTISNCGKACE